MAKKLNKVFFTMPKTAGGILAHKLGKVGVRYIGHCSLVKSKREMKQYIGENYTVFCFVRNPFSRLISAYDFVYAGGIHNKGDLAMSKILKSYHSFSDFCIDIKKATDNEYAVHFYPQSKWVNGDTVIGRYENLLEDIKRLGDELGFEIDLSQEERTQNLISRKPDMNRFTPEVVETVMEYHKEDFNRFNYTR
ncbi:MAG: sulfotransferase family 2 domain-containing protein [Gammaproteobacteria bacterium]|nr:sulfotransferase family 2 domain-containing protein [Gammaproteobacteria bacterium]